MKQKKYTTYVIKDPAHLPDGYFQSAELVPGSHDYNRAMGAYKRGLIPAYKVIPEDTSGQGTVYLERHACEAYLALPKTMMPPGDGPGPGPDFKTNIRIADDDFKVVLLAGIQAIDAKLGLLVALWDAAPGK